METKFGEGAKIYLKLSEGLIVVLRFFAREDFPIY